MRNKDPWGERIVKNYSDVIYYSWIFSEWYEKAIIIISLLLNLLLIIFYLSGKITWL